MHFVAQDIENTNDKRLLTWIMTDKNGEILRWQHWFLIDSQSNEKDENKNDAHSPYNKKVGIYYMTIVV